MSPASILPPPQNLLQFSLVCHSVATALLCIFTSQLPADPIDKNPADIIKFTLPMPSRPCKRNKICSGANAYTESHNFETESEGGIEPISIDLSSQNSQWEEDDSELGSLNNPAMQQKKIAMRLGSRPTIGKSPAQSSKQLRNRQSRQSVQSRQSIRQPTQQQPPSQQSMKKQMPQKQMPQSQLPQRADQRQLKEGQPTELDPYINKLEELIKEIQGKMDLMTMDINQEFRATDHKKRLEQASQFLEKMREQSQVFQRVVKRRTAVTARPKQRAIIKHRVPAKTSRDMWEMHELAGRCEDLTDRYALDKVLDYLQDTKQLPSHGANKSNLPLDRWSIDSWQPTELVTDCYSYTNNISNSNNNNNYHNSINATISNNSAAARKKLSRKGRMRQQRKAMMQSYRAQLEQLINKLCKEYASPSIVGLRDSCERLLTLAVLCCSADRLGFGNDWTSRQWQRLAFVLQLQKRKLQCSGRQHFVSVEDLLHVPDYAAVIARLRQTMADPIKQPCTQQKLNIHSDHFNSYQFSVTDYPKFNGAAVEKTKKILRHPRLLRKNLYLQNTVTDGQLLRQFA